MPLRHIQTSMRWWHSESCTFFLFLDAQPGTKISTSIRTMNAAAFGRKRYGILLCLVTVFCSMHNSLIYLCDIQVGAIIYMTTLLRDDVSQLMSSGHRSIFSPSPELVIQSSENLPVDYKNAPRPVGEGTANATLVFLARNSDLPGVLSSMQHLEDHFNKRFGYPWVFLNEQEFSAEFKSYVAGGGFSFRFVESPFPYFSAVQEQTSAPVSFGLIPENHWYQPDSIDEERATQSRMEMQAANIIYAGTPFGYAQLTQALWQCLIIPDSVPYRNMCRFNSGVSHLVATWAGLTST